MRLVLAGTALLAVWVDPTQPEHLARSAYLLLVGYVALSATAYARSLRATVLEQPGTWGQWLDIVAIVMLVALTGGASTIFFALFFFPILVVAFRSGFAAGMTATIAALVAFLVVGLGVAQQLGYLEVNRLMLRGISLLVIGFVISSRGGFETLLRERLALLKEIGRLSNPRLGTDRTIATSLERLRAFCDADDCLLVLADGGVGHARVRRATRGDGDSARHENPLPERLAEQLLSLPPEHALVHPGVAPTRPWHARIQQYDVVSSRPVPIDTAMVAHLAEWFAPRSFATVPVLGRGGTIGRLYVASSSARMRPADVEFLLQVVDCLLPLIENIRLVDRLAASAAEEERHKIARDVHDSVIQPYIGLQLALNGLHRRTASALRDGDEHEREALLHALEADLHRLVDLMTGGVDDLRSFVTRLRTASAGGAGFEAILRSYARRFGDLTGIGVQIDVGPVQELDANDRLSAEVFQMIAEGLSNVRRHTASKRAGVRVRTSESGVLEIAIENDTAPGQPATGFVPRSIADRARSLQGWTIVDELPSGRCAVTVRIPL